PAWPRPAGPPVGPGGIRGRPQHALPTTRGSARPGGPVAGGAACPPPWAHGGDVAGGGGAGGGRRGGGVGAGGGGGRGGRPAGGGEGGGGVGLLGGEGGGMRRALQRQGRFVVLRQYVTTSGRKLRAHSAREVLGLLARLALAGPKSVRQREGLELWYGERRSD